jgi:glycerophosphoryl diester phosphodiesterase
MSAAFDLDGPVEIVAHRGYSARAPENTLAALELAIAVGADALEFDVHAAACGVPMLFHDATLDRTTNGSGPIREKTVEELAGLDAGGWFGTEFAGEPIPTLESALTRVRGRVHRLYPELKGYGAVSDLAHVADLVERAGALEAAVFISMDWDALDTIRGHTPTARIGYIVERADRLDGALERAKGDPNALLDVNAAVLLADPTIAERARGVSVELAAWTVNSPTVAARLLGMGVPRITTNEVEALLAWKATL